MICESGVQAGDNGWSAINMLIVFKVMELNESTKRLSVDREEKMD